MKTKTMIISLVAFLLFVVLSLVVVLFMFLVTKLDILGNIAAQTLVNVGSQDLMNIGSSIFSNIGTDPLVNSGFKSIKSKSSAFSWNKSSPLYSSLSLTKVRYFSMNEGNNSALVINSRPEQVVFENGKAVLMLPPLKAFVWLIENSNKDGKITNPGLDKFILEFKDGKPKDTFLDKYIGAFKDFHLSLLKVLHNLDGGFYKFEFYLYVSDTGQNSLLRVYTFDPFDKDSLNLLFGNYGYTKFGVIIEYLNEKMDNRLIIHNNTCYLITECLREILENEESKITIDLNKDTLLVITESSKQEYDENVENDDNIKHKCITVAGLPVGEIKRFY
jgi:hypothetical protein